MSRVSRRDEGESGGSEGVDCVTIVRVQGCDDRTGSDDMSGGD